MADNRFALDDLLQNWLDVGEGRSMLEISWFNARAPLSIVDDLRLVGVEPAWLDQSVETMLP